MDLLDIFKDTADTEAFPAGTLIMKEGEEGHLMYVVLNGEVTVSLHDKVLAVARPGEIVGEMALINSDIRSATVTAKTDCELVPIDQGSFESMLRHVPDFSMYVMNVLATRLQSAYDMIED